MSLILSGSGGGADEAAIIAFGLQKVKIFDTLYAPCYLF